MDTDTLAVFADLRETALEPLLDAAMAALAPVLAHLAAATGAFPLDGRHDDPDPDPRATPQQEETR